LLRRRPTGHPQTRNGCRLQRRPAGDVRGQPAEGVGGHTESVHLVPSHDKGRDRIIYPGCHLEAGAKALCRRAASSRTSSPSRSPSSPSGAALQILSSYTNSYRKNIRNVPSHRCPTSTRWNTCEETASDQTSRKDGPIHCTASSSAYLCIRFCGELCLSSTSSRAQTGTST